MYSTAGIDVLPSGLPPLEVQILLSHYQASADSPKSGMPSLAQPRELRFLCHKVDHRCVTCWCNGQHPCALLGSVPYGAPSEALSRASPRGVAEALQKVTRQLQQISFAQFCVLSVFAAASMGSSRASDGLRSEAPLADLPAPRGSLRGIFRHEQREDGVQHPLQVEWALERYSQQSQPSLTTQARSWKEHQGEL